MERIALPKNENKFQILNQYISNTRALSILPNIPIFRFVLLFTLFALNLAHMIFFSFFGLIFNLYFPLMLTQNVILCKIQLVNKPLTFWMNTLFFQFGFCYCDKHHDQSQLEEKMVSFILQLQGRNESGGKNSRQGLRGRTSMKAACWSPLHCSIYFFIQPSYLEMESVL